MPGKLGRNAMRLVMGMTIGLAALSGLSACGPTEAQLRNTTREALLLGCRNGAAADRATLTRAGISVDRYCTCSVDRYVQGLTSEQLKEISRNPGNVPGLEAAAAQCVGELMPAGASGAPTTGNEGAPVATEAPAPAPAAQDGEAAEGNEASEQ
jgi:hypothetical protein